MIPTITRMNKKKKEDEKNDKNMVMYCYTANLNFSLVYHPSLLMKCSISIIESLSVALG